MHQREAERDALLAGLETRMRSREGVIAAWLGGSLGRGTADAWSDLDVWIVVADHAIVAIRDDPRAEAKHLLAAVDVIEAPRNAPRYGAYLLVLTDGETGLHQVDFYWMPRTGAARPFASRLLFDRSRITIPLISPIHTLTPEALRPALADCLRTTWLLTGLGGKYIVRGDARRAQRSLEYLEETSARLDWLLEHRLEPTFDDLARYERVRDPMPTDARAQLARLMELLGGVCDRRVPCEKLGMVWPEAAERGTLRWAETVKRSLWSTSRGF